MANGKSTSNMIQSRETGNLLTFPDLMSRNLSITNPSTAPTNTLHSNEDEPETNARDVLPMDDKDFRYLDTKIQTAEERGRLRLEAIMERIEGKFDLVTSANNAVQRELLDIKQSQSGNRNITLGVLVPLIIASVLALGGLFIGTKQVWEMGVQTGQTIQANPPPVAKSP